jgi:peptide/nickel transport system substrate-binding protein
MLSPKGRPGGLPYFVLLLLLAAMPIYGATRPRYGGTLRVQVRQAPETPDPPPFLSNAFTITRWEAGRTAVYEADDNAPGGRPFLDSVEVTLGRPLRDQSIDLELGKADVVELGPSELRRSPPGRKIWTSSPVRVLALVFSPKVDDARVREALALAIDRAAIHTVLFQRQGEVSAALLPQWLSGYAFLFPVTIDVRRAQSLGAGARPLSIAVDDPSLRPVAERIVLDARAAGLNLSVINQPGNADLRLTELRITSQEPAKALASIAASLGLPEPPRVDAPEALYSAERALLDNFRIVPLLHLPDVYGASQRVKGGPAITPLGEWRFENLWLEGTRP